jgi:hypothetical protein
MQTVPYWPFVDPLYLSVSSTSAVMDQAATFQPDVGPAITRRRITARVDIWSGSVIMRDYAQLAQFENWFDNDLAAGTKPFIWRRSDLDAVAFFKFAPASYSKAFLGNELCRLSFDMMVLPGVPFCAPYMTANSARAPDWIADYSAGRFWNGQAQVTAAALRAAVSGGFDVLEQRADTQVWRYQTYSNDLPLTAPSGVTWLAGFKA